MRRLLLILIILCALLGPGAAAEENLLYNGGFEETEDGLPLGWITDMWANDPGISYLELREEGMDGTLCVLVENVASNDARFIQEVEVLPDTVYRLSGWVRTDGIPEGNAGASISLMNTYASLPAVHDTDGEWVELACYIRTAATHTTLTVAARLGDYSADNTGKAYFDDLALVRVQDASAENIIQLYDYETPLSQSSLPDATEQTPQDIILPLLLLFAVVLVALWILRRRGVPYPQAAIWLVLAVAAAVRLYLMATQPGYPNDMACFHAWSLRMADVGPNAFYAADYFCDYPPGYMYLLWITGIILRLFRLEELDMTARVVVKLLPMLLELGTVYLLWHLGRRRIGQKAALLLAALYALSPAMLIDGAAWGQVDAVLALGLLLTLIFAVRGEWKIALPLYAVSVLIKPQALLVAPLGLAALIVDAVRAREKAGRIVRDAAIGLGISAAIAAVMLLPFVWGEASPLQWIIDQYGQSLGSYNYATLNTANLYYLLGANWVALDTMLGPLSLGAWGTALMVVVIAGTVALYIWRGDRERLPFFCALMFMGLYLLGVKMHERYLFPIFALLLYAYIRRRDWRLLLLFAGFSTTFFINCAVVLRDLHLPTGYGALGMALSIANLLLYGVALWTAIDPHIRPLPQIAQARAGDEGRLETLRGRTGPMFALRGRDWLLMLGLTAIYAVVAFVGLGSSVAPETVWMSTGTQEEVIFDLGDTKSFHILYYGGINHRQHRFSLSFSNDGELWMDEIEQKLAPGDCFRWQYATEAKQTTAEGYIEEWSSTELVCTARYVRLSVSNPAMSVVEFAMRDLDGNVLPVIDTVSIGAREESAVDPALLIDEPQTVPEQPSYYNGTYFDEIYHARTGYEHANGLSTYETTHPPLGKVFIMWGIQLFGMNPFGWRFMGALAGVLMIPAMYLMGKLLFRKTRYALLAAFLMAFDMMHLTQTRIATIDSYAVLFIILMYLCMFCYLKMSFFRDKWRTLIPLGLAGLFMGLGCASKWICMYAGLGLAVLFAWSMLRHFLDWRAGIRAGGEFSERVRKYPTYLLGTLCACIVFFLLIPFAIYYFSYIPYFVYDGGLTFTRFWDAQVSMFSYHANLVDDHAFQSPWYEWPLMLKPMYYFNGSNYAPEGMISTIMCMGNPAVWWVGLAALLYVLWRWLSPHLFGGERDSRPAMILLGFLAQFVPWMLVSRSTFIYHYFGSLPFVMLCIVYAMERIAVRWPRRIHWIQGAYMAVVLGLFIAFYPIGTGVQVSAAWANAVNWLRFLYLPGWQYKGWLYY